MLVKVKDGSGMRMSHKGKWYNFNAGQTLDCPESILSAFRGLLVSAEPKPTLASFSAPYVPKQPSTMPVINAEQPKIKIPVKIKTSKTTKKKTK